jgi:hypothetical protein
VVSIPQKRREIHGNDIEGYTVEEGSSEFLEGRSRLPNLSEKLL